MKGSSKRKRRNKLGQKSTRRHSVVVISDDRNTDCAQEGALGNY
ncbi:hypothetical protein HanRHA438_Chr16g0751041 [Helianthus annuus]|nr:hypothetical protein HanIR_Chr16g0803231 [Helianthus annuus]KAJ0820476.1 hypothetical protein HanPSC8_Chr16g0708501 [Helianthus annuus]KAJ0835082.1 hypothetical protein HanRHA438_Chr16g0751041 [Helianthus annuus]